MHSSLRASLQRIMQGTMAHPDVGLYVHTSRWMKVWIKVGIWTKVEHSISFLLTTRKQIWRSLAVNMQGHCWLLDLENYGLCHRRPKDSCSVFPVVDHIRTFQQKRAPHMHRCKCQQHNSRCKCLQLRMYLLQPA